MKTAMTIIIVGQINDLTRMRSWSPLSQIDWLLDWNQPPFMLHQHLDLIRTMLGPTVNLIVDRKSVV